MMQFLERSTFFRNCLLVALVVGLTFGVLAVKTYSRAQIYEADRAKEEQNSIQILKIFRAIEERKDTQIPELFQPDFEIHWPPSLPYGGTFRGLTNLVTTRNGCASTLPTNNNSHLADP